MDNVNTALKSPIQDEGEGKPKKQRLPNNAFHVPVKSTLEFFKWWCVFLRSFVSLTDREIDVIASLLKQRWELSKSISDPAILDTMMMSSDTIDKVVNECDLTKQHFYVIMSTLRRKKIINNNKIYAKLIPNMRVDDNGVFQLLIMFEGKD